MNNKVSQTKVRKIPKDWKIMKLSNIGEIITGTTPPTKNKEYWGEGYPFVTPSDFSKNKYVHLTERTVTNKGAEKGRLIPKDSVMVTCIASVGEVAMASKECITNQQINTIICNKKIDPHFIYYEMLYNKPVLKRWAGITTSPIIKKSLFEKFSIPLPPFLEQQKIAEILGTVDEVIEKVDKAIEKTERLKKGLMQELLTKGIGHKEFKDTKIGRFPKEWEVVRLGDSKIAEIRGNKKFDGFDDVAFIPMELVSDYEVFTKFEIRAIEEVKSFTYCESGDLLIAKITPSLENGKQGIVPEDIPNHFALATTEVFPIVCKGINKYFLFYVLKFSKYRNRIIASMTGTTGRQRASKVSVERLRIPLPHCAEQQEIVEILSTIDKKIDIEKKRKEKSERIKKGLMQDLLTGQKRVKI